MNKYEKLIEHIVNDEQDKARALFHEIVVEKSRDIYESLMDEEDPHGVGGDQVGGLVDEISADEHGMHEDDKEELGMDDEEFGTDDDMGDMGGDEGEHLSDEEQTERILDLEDALEELKAEFDSLMSDEEGEEEHMGGDDMGDDEAFGSDDEMMESEEEDEEEDEEEETTESRNYRKSDAEKLREYVNRVSDGHGVEKKGGAEGSVVGSNQSSKPTVNSRGIVAGKNDMGGTAANIVKGGSEQAPDGTSPKGKTGGFVKGSAQEHEVAKRNVNKVGGNKGAQNYYNKKETSWDKARGKEGQTTDGSVPVSKNSPLAK